MAPPWSVVSLLVWFVLFCFLLFVFLSLVLSCCLLVLLHKAHDRSIDLSIYLSIYQFDPWVFWPCHLFLKLPPPPRATLRVEFAHFCLTWQLFLHLSRPKHAESCPKTVSHQKPSAPFTPFSEGTRIQLWVDLSASTSKRSRCLLKTSKKCSIFWLKVSRTPKNKTLFSHTHTTPTTLISEADMGKGVPEMLQCALPSQSWLHFWP